MTFRQRLEHAAFWDGWVCTACDALWGGGEEMEFNDPCPECGVEALIPAQHLIGLLERMEEEE
jgi:hypothetical protein